MPVTSPAGSSESKLAGHFPVAFSSANAVCVANSSVEDRTASKIMANFLDSEDTLNDCYDYV